MCMRKPGSRCANSVAKSMVSAVKDLNAAQAELDSLAITEENEVAANALMRRIRTLRDTVDRQAHEFMITSEGRKMIMNLHEGKDALDGIDRVAPKETDDTDDLPDISPEEYQDALGIVEKTIKEQADSLAQRGNTDPYETLHNRAEARYRRLKAASAAATKYDSKEVGEWVIRHGSGTEYAYFSHAFRKYEREATDTFVINQVSVMTVLPEVDGSRDTYHYTGIAMLPVREDAHGQKFTHIPNLGTPNGEFKRANLAQDENGRWQIEDDYQEEMLVGYASEVRDDRYDVELPDSYEINPIYDTRGELIGLEAVTTGEVTDFHQDKDRW